MIEQSAVPKQVKEPQLFGLRALACAVYGALLSFAFPPFGVWPFVVALPLLFVLVARSSKVKGAFGLGLWFGVAFFAQHLFWLPNSLSEIFGPVAWGIYPPIVIIEGLFWGSVTGLSRAAGRRGSGTLLLLPALWLIMEWARAQGPLAFPWGGIGYMWLGTPLAQTADLAGIYGLSLATLVVAALVAVPFTIAERGSLEQRSKTLVALLAALALSTGAWFYGNNRLAQPLPEPDREVLLVQGNTDPMVRYEGTSPDFEIYVGLTEGILRGLEAPPDLIVWPEGAATGPGVQIEGMSGEAWRLRIRDSAATANVITGASSGRFNSVFGLADGRITNRYDKVYLVPYGEGLLFEEQLQPIYEPIYRSFGLGSFGRLAGNEFTAITLPNAVAAAYICYESVFPQVARTMVAQGAEVLVNISNDAWFGVGSGAEQHFAMGSMRAIETRRYLLRAGNDGITAVIDSFGRTTERIPRFAASGLLGEYALNSAITPYVRYGDWLIIVVAFYSAVLLLLGLRRRSKPDEHIVISMN